MILSLSNINRKTGSSFARHGGRFSTSPVSKPKNFKKTLARLLKYLGEYKISILIVLIFAVASTVLSILGPMMLGKATDNLLEGVSVSGGSGVDFSAIGRILSVLVFMYVLSALLMYVQGYIVCSAANRLTRRMRTEINEKLHRLPFTYYDRNSNGDILSVITNDVDTINQSFNQSITQIVTSVTTVVGILVMMFAISWQMTLVSAASLVFSLLAAGAVIGVSQKYFKTQQDYLGAVNGTIDEVYSAHVIVKAFCAEEKSVREFRDKNNILYSSAWKANFLSGLMMPLMLFISNVGYVAVFITGAALAINGLVSIGGIQAFVQYMRQFNHPVSTLSQISGVIQQTIAAAERVFALLDAEEELPETDDMISLSEYGLSVRGDIEFQDVSFSYTKDCPVIKNLSISVRHGQKVAIVGPTGAGKTTIVKLLMRFYELDSGRILIDGNDIKTIKKDSLRSLFGMVLQDAWLYNASVEDNIRYGRLAASKEEVVEAAKTARVHSFVQTLPGGYKMQLNEESANISQGQKQLLTISRVILANPKILILDEATSSVDTRTEVLIQNAMDHLMNGRTSFIIAHRLSTVKNADVILVMDKGGVAEQGTHDELIRLDGLYADIYNSQFAFQK